MYICFLFTGPVYSIIFHTELPVAATGKGMRHAGKPIVQPRNGELLKHSLPSGSVLIVRVIVMIALAIQVDFDLVLFNVSVLILEKGCRCSWHNHWINFV